MTLFRRALVGPDGEIGVNIVRGQRLVLEWDLIITDDGQVAWMSSDGILDDGSEYLQAQVEKDL